VELIGVEGSVVGLVVGPARCAAHPLKNPALAIASETDAMIFNDVSG
jgi:hypothetical protein